MLTRRSERYADYLGSFFSGSVHAFMVMSAIAVPCFDSFYFFAVFEMCIRDRAPRGASPIAAWMLWERVRKARHSPTPLWDIKPVGEHLACIVSRLSEYRTVAGWHVPESRDHVFARMAIDERF